MITHQESGQLYKVTQKLEPDMIAVNFVNIDIRTNNRCLVFEKLYSSFCGSDVTSAIELLVSWQLNPNFPTTQKNECTCDTTHSKRTGKLCI